MSFRAGNKFRISCQSFTECLLWHNFPPLLKLLTLSEGRTYPSTNNAHRKTLIENDQYRLYVGSPPRGTEKRKKKKENKAQKPFVISDSQQMYAPNLSNQISFTLVLSGNWYQLILHNFLSILCSPFSSKRSLYFFTPGRILTKINKYFACTYLEENIDVNSSLPRFFQNKSFNNNIIYIHHHIASSVMLGKGGRCCIVWVL